jgi:hypothetical protein
MRITISSPRGPAPRQKLSLAARTALKTCMGVGDGGGLRWGVERGPLGSPHCPVLPVAAPLALRGPPRTSTAPPGLSRSPGWAPAPRGWLQCTQQVSSAAQAQAPLPAAAAAPAPAAPPEGQRPPASPPPRPLAPAAPSGPGPPPSKRGWCQAPLLRQRGRSGGVGARAAGRRPVPLASATTCRAWLQSCARECSAAAARRRRGGGQEAAAQRPAAHPAGWAPWPRPAPAAPRYAACVPAAPRCRGPR